LLTLLYSKCQTYVGTVGVSGTGNITEPLVEKNVVLGHILEDRNMSGSVVVQNFRSTSGITRVLVGNLLFSKETLEVRLEATLLDECLIRVVGTVQAEGSAGDRVIGIVVSDIVGRGQLVRACDVLQREADVQWVAETSANHTVDIMAIGETSSKSIERSVLLNQDNDIFDIVLPGMNTMAVTVGLIVGLGSYHDGKEGYDSSLDQNHITIDMRPSIVK
jgi:hypothetical protein